MSVVLTIAGQTFNYPTTGNDGWGEEASNWALAVSTQLLQRTGGSFSLTNDVNFGASFATIQTYLKSRSSTIASAGFVRMAKGDSIQWRNNGDGGNVVLAINSSDEVTINGTPVLLSPGGVLAVADGGTGFGSYSIGDLLYASGAAAFSKLGIGTSAFLLKSTGTAPSWGLLLNANVDAAAAIARTKLASGSINHVVINDGSGVMSSEAQLAGTRGGTGVSSTATFPTSGVVVTEAASETLTNKTLSGVKQSVTAASGATYVALTTDILIAVNSGTTTQVTLPAASGNSGTIYRVKKTDATFTAVTVTDSTFSTTINTQGECVDLQSNGTTYLVVNRYVPGVWTSFTPTGLWTTNATYSGFWRRVGDSAEVTFKIACAGAPAEAGNLDVAIPSGLVIDTAKIAVTANNTALGVGTTCDSGTAYLMSIFYVDTTHVALQSALTNSGSNPQPSNFGSYVSKTSPFTFGNGDAVFASYKVPISGWNG
jgi:hypothetical protein